MSEALEPNSVAALAAEIGRLSEAVRMMRGTDALLRAQVAGLEVLRDAYAKERGTALALVREAVPWMGGALEMANPGDLARLEDWLARARALLGDGAA